MTSVTLPLERDEIKRYLPHREPMLFLDRVTNLEDMTITVESTADPAADYFKGHFPDMPIQPGVLLVETVAQAGALLVMFTDGLPENTFMGFSSIDSAKFKKPVLPGDKMVITVEIVKKRLPFYQFSGEVCVNDTRVANVEFKAAHMRFDKK